MWGVAAALLLFALYMSWETARVEETIEATSAQAAAEIARQHALQEKLAIARREAIILTDPESVRILMATGSKGMPKLEAVWHAKLGIVVAGQNVPMPSGNRTLQLWLIPKTPGAKPMPSMMVRPDTAGKFLHLVANPPHAMGATKALAITEEPASGSQAPTTKPIWVGTIG